MFSAPVSGMEARNSGTRQRKSPFQIDKLESLKPDSPRTLGFCDWKATACGEASLCFLCYKRAHLSSPFVRITRPVVSLTCLVDCMRQTLTGALAPWACPAYDPTYHVPYWSNEGVQTSLILEERFHDYMFGIL